MERRNLPDMFYGAKREIFQNAELLRKNLTQAERILWSKLNNKQLGVRFKAQHPIDLFIVDFYCHRCKIVVEIDGEIHAFLTEYDAGRTFELESWGLLVLRFKNKEIFENIDKVVDKIKETVKERLF